MGKMKKHVIHFLLIAIIILQMMFIWHIDTPLVLSIEVIGSQMGSPIMIL